MKSRHKPLYQFGLNMVEVLVALLLISIGVLGMVTMRGRTARCTTSSIERSRAAMLGSDLLESTRASPEVLYDVRDQMATQSDFFKAKGSTFPATPFSCTPLPNTIKDRLGCWAEQAKNELPGTGDLLKSDYYIRHSSELGDCDGKDSMLETHLAWRGKQGAYVDAADSSADTSLCYYTLRIRP